MYRAKITTMMQAYPLMISGDGVFTDLQSYNVPWQELNMASVLDIAYTNHSGLRNVTKTIQLLSQSDGSLAEQQRTTIARLLFTLFNDKWDKLYNDYTITYNPIQNYNVTEHETIGVDTTDTGTRNTQSTHTGTDTVVVDGERRDTGTLSTQETHTGTDTIVTDNDVVSCGSASTSETVYGFNSSGAVNSAGESGTGSNTTANDTTQTDTRNLSDSSTDTHNLTHTDDTTTTDTKNLSDSGTETRNLAGTSDSERDLTRSGNIGVTTTQQMLSQDIELWKWNFFSTVFEDIDSILVLQTYPAYSES